jgi:hypothetical protein
MGPGRHETAAALTTSDAHNKPLPSAYVKSVTVAYGSSALTTLKRTSASSRRSECSMTSHGNLLSLIGSRASVSTLVLPYRSFFPGR